MGCFEHQKYARAVEFLYFVLPLRLSAGGFA
jgi:hypothetical protein